MSTSTSNFLQNAKNNLKRVSTHDETKQHGYLGRVVDEASSRRPRLGDSFRSKESPAAYQSSKRSKAQTVTDKTLGGDFGAKTATGSVGTGRPSREEMKTGRVIEPGTGSKAAVGTGLRKGTEEHGRFGSGLHEKGPEEDFGFVGVEDLNEQIRIIEQDIARVMNKLKLSEDRINKHQIRKEQNMNLQRDAGLKAVEMRQYAEQKNEEKVRALQQEYELEKKKADLHNLAMESESERAKSIAAEKTNLDIQKIALRRAEEHERGIQFAKALKERYEYQMRILQTQKELLEFERRMKDVFSSLPLLNYEPAYIKHEATPEKIEPIRLDKDIFTPEKSVVSGTYDGESATIGELDAKLSDINYHIDY